MEHLTTLRKAQRVLDDFTLDAVRREHRVTTEELELNPADYRTIWNAVFDSRTRLFEVKVCENEQHGEDSLSLFYSARNHKYTLKILKATAAKAA